MVFFQHQRQTTKDVGGVRLRSRDVSMVTQLTRDVSNKQLKQEFRSDTDNASSSKDDQQNHQHSSFTPNQDVFSQHDCTTFIPENQGEFKCRCIILKIDNVRFTHHQVPNNQEFRGHLLIIRHQTIILCRRGMYSKGT